MRTRVEASIECTVPASVRTKMAAAMRRHASNRFRDNWLELDHITVIEDRQQLDRLRLLARVYLDDASEDLLQDIETSMQDVIWSVIPKDVEGSEISAEPAKLTVSTSAE